MYGLKRKHLRKRRAGQGAPIPAPSRYLRTLDRVTFIAGVAGPFTVLPQVYHIFHTHETGGISLTAWILISLAAVPWIFYGIAHRDKPIIVSFILWEVVNLLVVAGTLIYG